MSAMLGVMGFMMNDSGIDMGQGKGIRLCFLNEAQGVECPWQAWRLVCATGE